MSKIDTQNLSKVSFTESEKRTEDKFLFWEEKYNHLSKKIEFKFKESLLRIFLKDEGFRIYNDQPIQFIGKIAKKVTKEDMFKFTLKYIESFNELELQDLFITKGETYFLKNKAFVLSLPECEHKMLKDSKSISYKFYRNGVVIVEADKEFRLIPYNKLEGFVWEESIISRDFNLLGEDYIERAVFSRFVRNISNDDNHFESLCSSIGYLIHTYKDQRKPIAIIINDENLADSGSPEGGTGKGLLVKAVAQIVSRESYNGKNADFSNNKFAYQNVDETTAILLIDDAPRNFDFESLFSVLTDDLPVEKKHQSVKVIPYEESPKFVITTNYTIKGDSSSFKRRRFDVFLNNNYHDGHTPADDFGEEFFHGWDEEEWKLFDLFMIACLRLYLSLGLIPYENAVLKLKRFKNETSSDFYELMEEEFNEMNVPINYNNIRLKLISFYGDKYSFLNNDTKRIVDWVSRYAEFKGINLTKYKRNQNGVRFVLS